MFLLQEGVISWEEIVVQRIVRFLLAVLQVLIVEFSSVTGLSGDVGRGPNSVIISCVCDLYSSAFEILLV